MRYKHDCDHCLPLGEHGDADLYYCEKGGIQTVISRHGDEQSDYVSGLHLADLIPALGEAKRRAIEGYLIFREQQTFINPEHLQRLARMVEKVEI